MSNTIRVFKSHLLLLAAILLVAASSTVVSLSSLSAVGQSAALSASAPAEVQQQEVRAPKAQVKHVLKTSYSVFSVVFSPDGKQLASGGILNRTVSIWDVTSGKLVRELTEAVGSIQSLAYSPNGRYLAAGRGFLGPAKEKISISLWDAKTSKLIHNIPGSFPQARDTSNDVESMAFSPDSGLLAVATADSMGTIAIHDVNSGGLVKRLKRDGLLVYKLTFSPDGKHLAAGTMKGAIEIWDVNTGRLVKIIQAHKSTIASLAYSPDGKFIASGTDTGVGRGYRDPATDKFVQVVNEDPIHLWDVSSSELARTFAGHTGSVESLAYSPNGQFLASGSLDQTIRLWDPVTGQLRAIAQHGYPIKTIAFSWDGQYLASGGGEYVKLWEVQS